MKTDFAVFFHGVSYILVGYYWLDVIGDISSSSFWMVFPILISGLIFAEGGYKIANVLVPIQNMRSKV